MSAALFPYILCGEFIYSVNTHTAHTLSLIRTNIYGIILKPQIIEHFIFCRGGRNKIIIEGKWGMGETKIYWNCLLQFRCAGRGEGQDSVVS